MMNWQHNRRVRRAVFYLFFVFSTLGCGALLLYLVRFAPDGAAGWHLTVNLRWLLRQPGQLEDYGRFFGLVAVFIALAWSMKQHWLRRRHVVGLLALVAAAALFPWLNAIVFNVFFFLVTSATGLYLLRRLHLFDPDRDALQPLVFFVAGLLAIVAEVLILSRLHLVLRQVLVPLLLLKAYFLRREGARIAAFIRRDLEATMARVTTPASWLFLAVTLAFVVVGLLYALLPPFEYDTIAYHLAYPKIYAKLGYVPWLPALELEPGRFTLPNFWGLYPFNQELIFTYLYALGGESFCRIHQVMIFVLLLAAIIDFGRRHLSLSAGILAALVMASLPAFTTLAGTNYIEVNLALFGLVALQQVAAYLKDDRAVHLTLAGIVLGVAFGAKFLAIYVILAVGLVLVLHLIVFGRNRLRGLLLTTWFSVLAFGLGLPWYLRGYLISGDPIFPNYLMLKAGVWEKLTKPRLFPVDFFFNQFKSGITLEPEGTLGFMLLALTPFLFYFYARLRRRHLYFALTGIVFIFFCADAKRARYAFHLYPFVALLMAYGYYRFSGQLNRVLRLVATLAIVAFAVVHICYFRATWCFRGVPFEVLSPHFDPQSFVQNCPPNKKGTTVAAALNPLTSSDRDKILEFGWDIVAPLYFKGTLYSPSEFTLSRFADMLPDFRKGDPAALDRILEYVAPYQFRYYIITPTQRGSFPVDKLLACPSLDLVTTVGQPATYIFQPVRGGVHPLPALQGPPRIIKWGPQTTAAGQRFNAQPSGNSALWFNAVGLSSKAVVRFNNTPLATTSGQDFLTALLPDTMLRQEGKYPVCIENPETGKRSAEVIFEVTKASPPAAPTSPAGSSR